jgi:DNA-cytosine methyltransferase
MKLLRIGTDCSGIDAPIQALRQLGIPYKHVFSSEIDKYCVDTIKANYDTPIIFGDKDGDYPHGDIIKRDICNVPNLDLYVCGFPCQPFTQTDLGYKPGNVFWSCIDVIMSRQPNYFILESNNNITTHDNGNTWKTITETFYDLELLGYSVTWKIIKNGERMYMVGTKSGKFEFPEIGRYQDFPNDFKQVVSNFQMKKQFGNSTSVSVLASIIKNLI